MCNLLSYRSRYIPTKEDWGGNYNNNIGESCFELRLMCADNGDDAEVYRIMASGTGSFKLFKDLESYDDAVLIFGTLHPYATQNYMQIAYGFQRWC